MRLRALAVAANLVEQDMAAALAAEAALAAYEGGDAWTMQRLAEATVEARGRLLMSLEIAEGGIRLVGRECDAITSATREVFDDV